jgi:predicted transcriptional regulator
MMLGWNFGLLATNPINSSSRTPNLLSEPRSNGGINWSHIEVLSEPVIGKNFNTGESDSWGGAPSIAVENGKIYVVWDDNNATSGSGSDHDILYRHFDGNIWTDIQVISEPVQGYNRNTGTSYSPTIAVENEKIYVVWWDYSNTNGAGTDDDIFFRCNLTGSSWEPVQVISEPILGQNFDTGWSRYPDIAVENGKIHVVWHARNNTNGAGTDAEIFYRANLTSYRWEPLQVISEPVVGNDINTGDSFSPRIAIENSKIYIVWFDGNDTAGSGVDGDIFFRCNLTGSSWEPVQVISEPVIGQNINNERSDFPSIAVENGKIYVVWEDCSNINGAGGNWEDDIFYTCNLTGSSWEPVQVISEPVFGQNINTGGSTNPEIIVENANIYIVWSDNNDTNNAGTDSDIFYRCNLTNSGWDDVKIISEPVPGQDINTRNSWHPYITVENDIIHVVWEDENNTLGAGTDWDIFYKWKFFVPPSLFLSFPEVKPKVGNTSTEFNFSVVYNQLNNSPPTIVIVKIDDDEYSMLEVDQTDTNYTNGKKYYFKIKNLDIGNHIYDFIAFDENNFTNTRLFSNQFRYFKVVNTIPKILTEDNLTAIEDEYYLVTYVFEDIDIANVDQVCSWEFATNADWLNFNTVTGELYGTPGNEDVGQKWVYIAANDNINISFTNFTLTVININDKPTIITNNVEIAYEDKLYEVDYNATDIDSPIEHQLWSVDTNSNSWLNIDLSSGILMGTPGNDDVGSYWVNVSVEDGNDGRAWSNFTLTVIDTNDAPNIITENITTIYEDELYLVDYEAIDIDDVHTFEWYLTTNASWLIIDPDTGILSGTPTNDDVGFYFVNITVMDVREGNTNQNFTLEVINVNDAPEWIVVPGNIIVNESEKFSFEVNAVDVDVGDTLNFNISSNPKTDITIDPDTGLIEWRANINTLVAPEYTIEVNLSVTDGEESIWTLFKIKVIPNPRSTSKLISPGNNTIVSISKTELKWMGFDEENGSLTYVVYLSNDLSSIFNLLKSRRIIINTTNTSFKPSDLDIGGLYYWTVIPFNGRHPGRCIDGYFRFEVNTPPNILNIPPQKTKVGKQFEYTLKCEDPNDGDLQILNFSLEMPPDGMVIDQSTGMITWTPSDAQIGQHTVEVWVSDGKDIKNITFEIKVTKRRAVSGNMNEYIITSVSLIIILAAMVSFVGGTEIGKYKFLSLIFVPLYNRLHQEKVLDNYTRGQIHGYIKARPGEHYNAIKSALELKNGILAHHLRILEKEEYVISKRDGFYTRFYPKGIKITEPDTLQRNLIHVIDTQPGITQRKIISLLGSSQQVVSYNLVKLSRENILKVEPNGRENKYYINYEAADSYQTQNQL